MAEIEDNQDDHHKRRRPSAQTAIDVGPDQESHQEEGAQAGTLTEVASELHSTYGNQLVSSALCSGDSEGLQGAMAAQLGAAVGGLGAWSQETGASNTAMCRAMRHAQAGIEEEPPSAPINLSTGGSHLPEQVRQRMETAMGHDFSHVRIHTGGTAGAQAKQINAHAFTAGSHIYFGSGEFQPGTTQGDRLIAHELTHVIQHDEHRLSLPDSDRDVSKPSDPTEVEAYANEKQVLSELQTVDAALSEGIGEVSMEPARTTGEIMNAVAEGAAAQATSSTGSGVHRAVENPSTPVDADPTDDWDKGHRPIDLEDGFSADGADKPQAEFTNYYKQVNWEVKLLETRLDPLRVAATVSDEMLFEIVHQADPSKNEHRESHGIGIPVVAQYGTAHDPNIEVKAIENALYIDGAPTVDDVKQGGLGDCYFLGALINVLHHDPERIRNAVHLDGDNVRFTFWTTPDNGATWTRESVTTDRTALQWYDTADTSYNHDGLLYAKARIAASPITSDHFADVDEESWLSVVRADVYEMALWAPLMEKAYARIAERTNQYGGYRNPASSDPGYDQIDGGVENYVYGLFYGPDLVGIPEFQATAYTPGQDPIQGNKDAIANLLRVGGYRAGDGDTLDTDEHVMMTVATFTEGSIDRMGSIIDHCNGLDEMRRYPTLRRVMGQVKELEAAWRGVYTDPSSSKEDKAASLGRLSKGCERQVQPGAWPLLESENASPVWAELALQLSIVANLGGDSSNGERSVYANHSYSVLGASFAGADGAALGLNLDNLDAKLADISATESTVTLRNPHRTNEPTLPTIEQDSNSEDGIFGITLDTFMRAFAEQRIATVKDT
jgi:hypothetical protein